MILLHSYLHICLLILLSIAHKREAILVFFVDVVVSDIELGLCYYFLDYHILPI